MRDFDTYIAHSRHVFITTRICPKQPQGRGTTVQELLYYNHCSHLWCSISIFLPAVPGSSPLCASSNAKLSSSLPDRLDTSSERKGFECRRWLNDVMYVCMKSLHARKNGGAYGRHAALRTKSFSILFQMPMWIPSSMSHEYSLEIPLSPENHSQSNVLTSGFPRRDVLESSLITAIAKELVTISQAVVVPQLTGTYARPSPIRAIVPSLFHFGICKPQTIMPG